MATVIRNRVYLALAAALALFVFIGFAKTYYLRTLFQVPPITYLLHAHALAFTAWMVLFLIQVSLISKQNYRTHMQLGVAGMIVAALVFALGLATAFAYAGDPRPRPMGLDSPHFTFVPVFSILLFGGFVAAAFLLRKRGQLHKRLMVLAMIAILGPPTARIVRILGLGGNFLVIQTTVTALFVIAALATDWARHRAVHAAYSVGGTLLVLSWPARVWFAQTDAWGAVGYWMARVSAWP
jgi:hypothetical protein